ncbi:MAG: aspartate kinase [Deltaproteobacteria bacterium]|nr:aspartate kinase [Deltaproteobacteria bacterium]
MLIVQKYGGTSMGSVERIHNVARRVLRTQAAGHRVVVIVSAMAGETDRLLRLSHEVSPRAEHRELDVLLATGEQASASLLAMAVRAQGGKGTSFLGHQIRVLTDSAFSRARIQQIDATPLSDALERGELPIVAGFQGVDAGGNITTLGRGGSDTSAVAVAAAIGADLCEIYTDVEGVFTADPNICPDARKIPRISYEEMLELASLGAKVLQIRSVEVASNHGVALAVRSSFSEEEGTMVVAEDAAMEKVVVTGVSLDKNQARLTIRGLPWRAGVQADVFRPLGEAGIVVDMIVQAPPVDGRTNVSFTVPRTDLPAALERVQRVADENGGSEVLSDDKIAKISIVGVGMRSHSGVAQRMFELLAGEGIDILMISTSEIKVSCVIPMRYGELAMRSLHEGFALGTGTGTGPSER